MINKSLLQFVALGWLMICAACSSTSATSNFRREQNEEALKTARTNIEKFRKGDVNLKIVDAKGKLLPSAKVKIQQVSHAFKFGCYLKIDDLAPESLATYEANFGRLFNFAAVGTYWDFLETTRSRENWTWFERETQMAQKMNLRIEAAPILWGTIEFGTPKWLPRNKNELTETLAQHIQKTLAKGENVVEDWEVVNEPLAPKTDFFAKNAGADYIEKAFLTAREVSPQSRLMINEYGVFGAEKAQNYNREKYFELLINLKDKNVPFDVVGIQAHANGEWFAPANVAAELERYAALGKPLQITEFSAQTLEYDDRKTPLEISGNYQSGVWNAAKQAEFYREFYTVAFGNPHVEAITTWGLDDERAWLPGIGVIDENGKPKPNFEMLDRLINEEWRTNLETEISKGTLNFRGFYGEYEVETVVGGRKKTSVFKLRQSESNEWVFKFE